MMHYPLLSQLIDIIILCTTPTWSVLLACESHSHHFIWQIDYHTRDLLDFKSFLLYIRWPPKHKASSDTNACKPKRILSVLFKHKWLNFSKCERKIIHIFLSFTGRTDCLAINFSYIYTCVCTYIWHSIYSFPYIPWFKLYPTRLDTYTP